MTSSRGSRPASRSRSSTAWSATTGRRAGSGTACAHGAGPAVSCSSTESSPTSPSGGRPPTLSRRRAASSQHIAFHDPLTGLPNRVSFQEHLDDALDRCAAERSARPRVLFIDLDNFKLINDSFGHAAGDELLRAVAGRLARATRTADVVARQGGDEFLVLLADIEPNGNEDDPEYARKAAAVVARKIRRTLRAPFVVSGVEIFVSASIGVSLFPDDAPRLGDASQARGHRHVPRQGRRPRLPRALRARPRRRRSRSSPWPAACARAIERGDGLVLHYQPLVRLDAGRDRRRRGAHPLAGRRTARAAGRLPPARRADGPHRRRSGTG